MVTDELGPGGLLRDFLSLAQQTFDCAGAAALREYPRAIGAAFDLIGLKSGDRLAMSPLVPALYLDVCAERGVKPIFMDVEAGRGTIDPEQIPSGESRPNALLLDAPLGLAPKLDRAASLSELPIIEDISQALGAQWAGVRAGSLGQVAVASLEPEHIVTAGGGALITAPRKRDGQRLNRWAKEVRKEVVLPDFNSALATTQLKELGSYLERRRELGEAFLRALLHGRHRTLTRDEEHDHVWYSFPVLLEGGVKETISYARKNGVEATRAFEGTVLDRAVSEADGDAGVMDPRSTPNAYALFLRCVLFPLYPSLRKSDADTITRVLRTLP